MAVNQNGHRVQTLRHRETSSLLHGGGVVGGFFSRANIDCGSELFSSCSFAIFSAFENHIERGFIPPKVMPISYCLTLLRLGACPAFRINSLAGIS